MNYKEMKDKKILFLVPYPLHRAPSQRFRVELFFDVLQQNNISYKVNSFIDEATWAILYQHGSFLRKAWGIAKGFLRRIKAVLFTVHHYDYIFIHREASPLGPPVFEWIISKLWRKKIIYDFDDAIWIPNITKENRFVSWIKAFWKIKYICKWAYKVVGGNDYLCNYARKYNSNVVLIPTCVDVINHHVGIKDQHTEKVVIGWTGSHSTMIFLNTILDVLQKITKNFNTETIIISNKAPTFNLDNMRFIPWSKTSEMKDLLQMNIGIMPLQNDPWGEGKCGFKLVQYMSLGIPAVASPVGVNKQIIEEGINGSLCTTKEEWYNSLAILIKDRQLRTSMGIAGKQRIAAKYSVQANAGSFLGLFN